MRLSQCGLVFEETPYLFISVVAQESTFSPSVSKDTSFPTSLPVSVVICYLGSHSDWVRWNLKAVPICVFLMAKDVEHLPGILLATRVLALETCFYSSLANPMAGTFVFGMLDSCCSLYILVVNPQLMCRQQGCLPPILQVASSLW